MPGIMLKNISLTLIVLLQVACVVEVHSGNHGHDISKVFGGVVVGDGQSMGDVDSVNGGITLRDNSSADKVETVNGSIRIHDDVSVYSVETVNGSIRAGRNLRVKQDVGTVNGSIDLQKSTVIGDSVSTVNGSIHLEMTEVQRDIETVNGDIRLSDGSLVLGDVIFHENGWHFSRDTNLPRLVVDANSAIKGTVHLYRKVRLEIDENADVGEIVEHF